MSLLMILNDVMRPDHLSSDPYENSITIVMHFFHYFFINDLLSIMIKLAGFHKQTVDGKFKLLQIYKEIRYVETAHRKNRKKTIKLHSGIIHTETYPNVLIAQEGISDGESVASQI